MTSKIKKLLLITAGLLTLIIIGFAVWIFNLNQKVNESVKSSWFLPPLEIYSAPKALKLDDRIKIKQLTNLLDQVGFRNRPADKGLFNKDYLVASGEQCHIEDFVDIENCLKFKTNDGAFYQVNFTNDGIITSNYNEKESVETIYLPPQLFAQFYGDSPVLRTITTLDQYPFACLKAVTSIEDHQFLEHEGISIYGLLRAVTGVLTGKNKGGGSTITQQLVKNYFLTSERTIKRKVTEIFMALLLETKLSKEQILENYLNIIYMGQQESFQVLGFAAASNHYLNQDISRLNVPECALLAGVLNNPGRFNPFRHPEKSLIRRNKVLNDMFKNGVIDQQELMTSLATPLPKQQAKKELPTAPYFVDAIRKELKKLNIDSQKGLKVYSTLKPTIQLHAKSAIGDGIKHLYSRFKNLRDLKEKDNKSLQALLISVDLKTNSIQALIGGTSFLTAPYNRAVESHRQVGSLMKPLVYLTAIEAISPTGKNYHPLTTINDESFNHTYEGQSWSPKNYSKKSWGKIPMFFALKNSINISTAKLGLEVGLEGIIDVAKRLGIESTLEPFPSLTLGAFELYPMEVAQAYSSIARMGSALPVHLITKVTQLNGSPVYEFEEESEQVLARETAAVLIGMLKNTLVSGTAQSAKAWGFKGIAAGKTGTTSDSKDAWFAGFTPETLTLVWVGFDDNTTSDLTGASGALPIWSLFNRRIQDESQITDFTWPESVKVIDFTPGDLSPYFSNSEHVGENTIQLIYRNEDLSLIK